jgi:TetR/AcrR family tetracycline transcriptional repressor
MVEVKRTRGGTQPNALSRDDVLDAGLAIVSSDGLGALSVSAVARVLGVSSPAVYHYLRGKDDLVDKVCERVAREVVVGEATGERWDDRVVAIILSMNATFARYPGVAAHVLPFRRPSRAVERMSGVVRQCIIDGGFDDDTADDLLAALHFIVGGWLLGQRPNLPVGTTSPAMLERVVRWTLAGAVAEARPHDA